MNSIEISSESRGSLDTTTQATKLGGAPGSRPKVPKPSQTPGNIVATP